MSKLKQDEIKTVYMLEASDAQKKLNDLKKTNKELSGVMDARRKEMVKLETQGKKNSIEYKKLEKSNRDDSKAIRENTTLIRQQENAMGVNSLTMNQLKSRAKSLRLELNNISKELDPDRWNQVNQKLNETTARMNSLRTNTEEINKNLKNTTLLKGALASFWGNLYAQIAMKVGQIITKIRDVYKESVQLASQAQGIEHAFKRVANADYLQSLRKQTKGLVSDFTLMKSAVRAENFDIPLGQLGTLLEFAQNRARDTGESVDYLVESIINGIGRKSPLILDNLGISAVRLREEVKTTGDMATAVGNIIKEEMAAAGPAIDTATDAATRKKVAWENAMLAIGKFFTNFQTGFDNLVTRFLNGFSRIISKSDDAIKTYNAQIEKVSELETNVQSLASEYDMLTKKTNLNEKEQARVKTIMEQLIQVVPDARGEFDEYGQIVSVNTGKVREYIKAEQARIAIMRKSAIEQAKKNLADAKDKLKNASDAVDQGGYTKAIAGGGVIPTTTYVVDESSINKAINDRKKAGEDLKEAEQYLMDITGKSYEKQTAKRYEFNQMNLQALKKWIDDEKNAKNEFITLAQETYNERSAIEEKNIDKKDDDTAAEEAKKLLDKKLQELDNARTQEEIFLKEKYAAREITEYAYQQKLLEIEQEFLNKKLELAGLNADQRMQIESKLVDFRIKLMEETKALQMENYASIQEFFKTNQDLVETNLSSKEKLVANSAKREADKNIEEAKRQFKENEEFQKNALKLGQQYGNELGGIIGGFIGENDNLMKNSVVNMLELLLDSLQAQVTMSILGASAKAFEQLGPIGGAVASAAVTGLITTAFSGVKAFVRSKIGNVNGDSSSNSNTGSYVVSGKQSGGYIDVTREQDKKKYIATFNPNKRGFINRPTVIVGDGPAGKSSEWVASNDALQNPTISPFIKLLDESQKAGTIRTIDLNHIMRARMAGFESGGFIDKSSQQNNSPVPAPQFQPQNSKVYDHELLKDIRDLLSYLKTNGVKAPIVLTDIQRKQELLNKSQKIGSK